MTSLHSDQPGNLVSELAFYVAKLMIFFNLFAWIDVGECVIFFISTAMLIQAKVVEIFMSLRFHVEAHRQYPNPETSATIFSNPSKPIMVVSTSEWYEFGVCTILFTSTLKGSMKRHYSKNC
jgi:hypothetical protein